MFAYMGNTAPTCNMVWFRQGSPCHMSIIGYQQFCFWLKTKVISNSRKHFDSSSFLQSKTKNYEKVAISIF